MDGDRKRSAAVAVGTVALAVTAFVAIETARSPGSDAETEERAVCVDQNTDTRVSDDECDDEGSTVRGWYYIRAGRSAPAVGERISGQGSFSPQTTSFVEGGIASDGGEVSRGGFSSGKSSFGG